MDPSDTGTQELLLAQDCGQLIAMNSWRTIVLLLLVLNVYQQLV
jgi:hypothetical protein